MSIKETPHGQLVLEHLEVGDEVAIEGSGYAQNTAQASIASVVRITATRVVVMYTNPNLGAVESAFMIRTGREAGSTRSWRSRHLISIERKQAAQAGEKQEHQISHLEKMAETHLQSMLVASRNLPKRQDPVEGMEEVGPLSSSIIRTIGADLTECLVNAWKLRHGMPVEIVERPNQMEAATSQEALVRAIDRDS